MNNFIKRLAFFKTKAGIITITSAAFITIITAAITRYNDRQEQIKQLEINSLLSAARSKNEQNIIVLRDSLAADYSDKLEAKRREAYSVAEKAEKKARIYYTQWQNLKAQLDTTPADTAQIPIIIAAADTAINTCTVALNSCAVAQATADSIIAFERSDKARIAQDRDRLIIELATPTPETPQKKSKFTQTIRPRLEGAAAILLLLFFL